jgi:hypothetical protein
MQPIQPNNGQRLAIKNFIVIQNVNRIKQEMIKLIIKDKRKQHLTNKIKEQTSIKNDPEKNNIKEHELREQHIKEDELRQEQIKEVALYRDKPYNKQQILEGLKLLQLTTDIIENVYQEKYNRVNATGLGDFIRGSYFLMQFCDVYNLTCSINIANHPVAQFLEMYQNKNPIVYKVLNIFELTNHNPNILDDNIITNVYDNSINNDFIHFLSKQRAFNMKKYVYTTAYPTDIIDQKHKDNMREILKPIDNLLVLVNNILTKFDLVKNNFIIIHIRYGDDYLINSEEMINLFHLEIISNALDKLDETNNYFLLSDNNIIKQTILFKYPFIKTHFNEISHTGQGIHLETNKLQNTMVDFYLISYASQIIAFSIYNHGTGFSKWCAETYDIPYVCRLLT